MFAITDEMISGDDQPRNLPTEGRRFYRGRNQLLTDLGPDLSAQQSLLPADPPFWDDMIGNSIRIGIRSAKRTFKPALGIWALMAAIATLYFLVPASQPAFQTLISWQDSLGILFPSVGMGLSVGILVELVKVSMSTKKRWTQTNTHDAIFNFIIFGLMGASSYYRYAFQDEVFGSGNSFHELAAKVCFDQFVWTILLANPYQSLACLWKNNSYSWRAVGSQLSPFRSFWGTQMLPVLISNWAFWIPMACLVYLFPLPIQLPLSILAVTIWVILLTILTSETSRNDS